MTTHISPTLAVLSALAVLAAVPALAQEASADLSWTGSYLGGSIGAGYLTTDQYSPPQSFRPDGYPVPAYAGWHAYGGIHAGIDHQLGQTVLGLRLQHAVTGSGPDSYLKVDELVSANAVALTTVGTRRRSDPAGFARLCERQRRRGILQLRQRR